MLVFSWTILLRRWTVAKPHIAFFNRLPEVSTRHPGVTKRVFYSETLELLPPGKIVHGACGMFPPNAEDQDHQHDDAWQIDIVLSGELAYWVDGEMSVVGENAVLFIPPGTPHRQATGFGRAVTIFFLYEVTKEGKCYALKEQGG